MTNQPSSFWLVTLLLAGLVLGAVTFVTLYMVYQRLPHKLSLQITLLPKWIKILPILVIVEIVFWLPYFVIGLVIFHWPINWSIYIAGSIGGLTAIVFAQRLYR